MTRSLPLSLVDSVGGTDSAGAIRADASVGVLIRVYDPAMCCSTGVCGPGADPALLRIARDLRWIEKHGATVERFGLAQDPAAFVANPRIAGLLQAFGEAALPAVLVNGDVLCHGRYATRDELVAALTPHATRPPNPCSQPGSGCC